MPYVGLVASRKRGATVRSLLEESGVPGVAAMRSPAGLDLGARTAPEVALSILAEIVQTQTSQTRAGAAAPAPAAATSAVDPVCGMSVESPRPAIRRRSTASRITSAARIAAAKFLKDPQAYLAHP